MNVLSDSESSDSDTGRRFKTESTRTRQEQSIKKRNDDLRGGGSSRREIRRYRSKSRSRSKSKSRSRNRTRSRERYTSRKRSKSRERSHRKYDRYENVEKSTKRHESGQSKQNDRDKDKDRLRDKDQDKDRDRDKDRDKDRERSSHQSCSSKSSDKYKSSSSHKKPHSKHSTSEEKSSSKSKSQSSDAAIDTNEKHKKHKKEKDKNRDERSNKSTDHEQRRSNDKQSDSLDTSHKRSADIGQSPEKNGNQEPEENADDNQMCGPTLPPHMIKPDKISDPVDPTVPTTSTEKKYGPTLPSDFVANSENTSYEEPKNQFASEDISESDDDELIGPVLDHIANKSEAYLELEKRALELKIAKLNELEKKDGDPIRGREEWMIELPEIRKVADLGLSARQFRTKERDEIKDRSQWTETPKDREEKQKRKGTKETHDDVIKTRHEKTERMYRERRDAEQEEAIKKHKKKHKRDESLVEMHQKKMKKKTQDKNEPIERRPFSRESDLKVNRFDEAQKKSVLKKAQLLDTRFSSGQSKFL